MELAVMFCLIFIIGYLIGIIHMKIKAIGTIHIIVSDQDGSSMIVELNDEKSLSKIRESEYVVMKTNVSQR